MAITVKEDRMAHEPTVSDTPLFAARGVSVRFGGVQALQDVSLEVAPHEVLGIIGPNGAGKTTLFNVLCGFVAAERGEMTWEGRTLTRVRPSRLARHGIARTLQSLGLFDRMTVLENVMVGAERHARTRFWTAFVGLGSRDEAAIAGRSRETLARLGIETYAARPAGSLPYPIRKKVALARALVSEPRLLLLDEPASGLSQEEMTEIGSLIRDLTESTATMLVEHHMDLVMGVCDRVTVLDFGKVIATGSPQQVQDDPAVHAAYLGAAVEAADIPSGFATTEEAS